jgi:hypothetical protein
MFRRQAPHFLAFFATLVAVGIAVSMLDLPRVEEAVLGLIATLGLASVPVYWFRRRKLGALAVELPWSAWNTRSFVVGCLSLLPTLSDVVFEGRLEALDLAWFGVATLSFLIGFDRFQIRDGGIAALGNVLPWSRISSLRWEGDNQRPVLRFETTGRLAAFRLAYWIVPAEQRSTMIEALRRLAPGKVPSSQGRPPNTGLELSR